MPRAELTQPPPIRVLLADSSRMGNQLLSNVFPRDRRLQLAGQAATTQEILPVVAAGCDVVVVAANLEREGGGIEATRLLRELHPSTRTVLLLDELRSEAVIAGFRAGARGVFGRSQSLHLLWKCIACVHAGQVWAGSQELQFLLQALQQSMPARINDPQGVSLLSEQEQRVVRHVCEGLSNREIAQRMKLSEHTIKNHLFRIYSRLGVSSRVEIMFSVLSQRVVRAPQVPAEEPTTKEAVFQMYLKQAEHSPLAQYMVGKMYLEGQGTGKDLVTGYMWLSMAQQTAREIFNNCGLAKNRMAAQIKAEEKTEAESRAAERLQPRWRSATLGLVGGGMPGSTRESSRSAATRQPRKKHRVDVPMVSALAKTSDNQHA